MRGNTIPGWIASCLSIQTKARGREQEGGRSCRSRARGDHRQYDLPVAVDTSWFLGRIGAGRGSRMDNERTVQALLGGQTQARQAAAPH